MKYNSLTSLILVLVQFLCIFGIVLYAGVRGNVLQNILSLVALILGFWAIFLMKFSVNIFPDVKENQQLYMSGPYKYIRHPMYTAVLLACGVWVTNRLDIVSVAIWTILFVDLIIKMNFEERKLQTKFPTYKQYMQKTNRLVPFIY